MIGIVTGILTYHYVRIFKSFVGTFAVNHFIFSFRTAMVAECCGSVGVWECGLCLWDGVLHTRQTKPTPTCFAPLCVRIVAGAWLERGANI
jgi:hypothetical protein